jgi:diguanylate cyclase (GGDEF)-like protein
MIDFNPKEEVQLKMAAQAAHFDFVTPENPKVDLTFRLENQSRYEVLVEKIIWSIIVEPKSIPSARGEFSVSFLLLARNSKDQLVAHGFVNHAEAAYLSQRRGLALSCHAQGTISGHVKGIAFEQPFACFDIPCVIEKESGPLSNAYIDPTHIDPLTGLLNRKFLTDNLETIVNTANNHRPVSFIMLDIDNFKEINDHYGHLIGDDALKAVCAKIREAVADKGFLIRFGGDEFSILLNNFDQHKANLLSEQIRTSVSNYQFKAKKDQIQLTVSVGVATMSDGATCLDLMQHADDMLRASKKRGKNQVSEWAA